MAAIWTAHMGVSLKTNRTRKLHVFPQVSLVLMPDRGFPCGVPLRVLIATSAIRLPCPSNRCIHASIETRNAGKHSRLLVLETLQSKENLPKEMVPQHDGCSSMPTTDSYPSGLPLNQPRKGFPQNHTLGGLFRIIACI